MITRGENAGASALAGDTVVLEKSHQVLPDHASFTERHDAQPRRVPVQLGRIGAEVALATGHPARPFRLCMVGP
jgi:hypothetical protein